MEHKDFNWFLKVETKHIWMYTRLTHASVDSSLPIPPGIRGSFDILESGYCECATIGQLKWTKASQWTTGEVHLFVNKIYRCWRSLENAPPWKLPSCQMPHVCPVGWGWGRLGIDWYFSLCGRCSFSSAGKVTDTLDVEFGMEGFHGGIPSMVVVCYPIHQILWMALVLPWRGHGVRIYATGPDADS